MTLRSAPTWALLFGASLWGVVWYPYRLLAAAGLDGVWSTLMTYGLALILGLAIFPREAARLRSMPPLAIVMGLAIGWSNLAYVVGVLHGEVMRVLLLFYLAPLWTVPLAWLFLRERLDATGLAIMALAFSGAMVMLWKPHLGVPWPESRAEWLGLLAGFLFALGNVLIRRLATMTDAGKSIVIWAGVALAALVHVPMASPASNAVAAVSGAQGFIVVAIGVVLVAMSLALQYGLGRMPANRAIVILLFELVVAAIASYYLAGEHLHAQDAIGAAFIVAATLAAALNRGQR
ncbi:MAG TPA: DMT family transporter [Usitatibacter sp.]|jgi:drug/metabolite transporter (DMT)-like permease|nr:DMT family transporter [Usitatibacter sp.]